jgi:hypothetical protein
MYFLPTKDPRESRKQGMGLTLPKLGKSANLAFLKTNTSLLVKKKLLSS